MTFDYKSYSLNQLKDWVHDAISSGDVTASEVYNAITSVVEEQIDYHAQNLSNLQELHSLLNGKKPVDYCMPPWGHSDMEALKYSDETLNAMCDAAEAQERNKVTKWILPVQQVIEEGIDNYYINFPDDLLEQTNWKEGDQLEWIPQDDGSYVLKKVNYEK